MFNDSDNTKPFAYLNYLVFDKNMVLVQQNWIRVTEAAGFWPNEIGDPAKKPVQLTFSAPVVPTVDGYIYVWVSNSSENTKVWFDDLKVKHVQSVVAQATDYGAWGEVLREQKTNSLDQYRYGYQGQFAEKDEETGWSSFELRQYDPVVGRWISRDPMRQYYSPYLGMGNNPVNGIDRNGGKFDNEYTIDQNTGEITQISDLGGDQVDFFHIGETRGDGSFVDTQALIVRDRPIAGVGANIYSFRFLEGPNSTVSSFISPHVTGDLTGFLLEPGGPSTSTANIDRRIPEGVFNIIKNPGTSNHSFRIYNNSVPISRAINIHIGNFHGDTDGCLLPGCSFGNDTRPGNNGEYRVFQSGAKLSNQLAPYIRGIGVGNVQLESINILNPN